MAIRNWPKLERPRERLIAHGEAVLSDAELLAVFLGSGLPGRSAVDVARGLLAEFGSLREVLNADRRKLLEFPGIGPARYARLRAALGVGRRYQLASMRCSTQMRNRDSVRAFLATQLRDRPYEVFACLFLDSRNRLIAFEELFRGTLDTATVHAREVVRQALLHNAAKVIFAHNHPSGVADPSEKDELITRQLRESLALVNVKVLDHLVVGEGQCVSFVERGLL